MAVGIILLGALVHDTSIDYQAKGKLIYFRLLDIMLKLDHIEIDSAGDQFLNMSELQIDQRLAQKYEAMSVIWGGGEWESASEIKNFGVKEEVEKDWSSLLDAVERDTTTLNNDYQFKQLIAKVILSNLNSIDG